MSDARRLLQDLVAARGARAAGAAAPLLSTNVRYWDCERGDLSGRDAVARALTSDHDDLELETLAVDGDDAVLELQLERTGRRRRSTEVYQLEGGSVASIRAYVDPGQRG